MVPRSSKFLLVCLGTLDRRQKAKYYDICNRTDALLKKQELGELTIKHCEYICEHLKSGTPITPRALKSLGSQESTAEAASSSSTPDLFASGDTESSSSSEQTT